MGHRADAELSYGIHVGSDQFWNGEKDWDDETRIESVDEWMESLGFNYTDWPFELVSLGSSYGDVDYIFAVKSSCVSADWEGPVEVDLAKILGARDGWLEGFKEFFDMHMKPWGVMYDLRWYLGAYYG